MIAREFLLTIWINVKRYFKEGTILRLGGRLLPQAIIRRFFQDMVYKKTSSIAVFRLSRQCRIIIFLCSHIEVGYLIKKTTISVKVNKMAVVYEYTDIVSAFMILIIVPVAKCISPKLSFCAWPLLLLSSQIVTRRYISVAIAMTHRRQHIVKSLCVQNGVHRLSGMDQLYIWMTEISNSMHNDNRVFLQIPFLLPNKPHCMLSDR